MQTAPFQQTGPKPAASAAGGASNYWHFAVHQQWAETPRGRRVLAAYPQVKPRTPQEEANHRAFARRVLARYAPPPHMAGVADGLARGSPKGDAPETPQAEADPASG
nr:hypothetical protein [Pandoravirus massiliensis]